MRFRPCIDLHAGVVKQIVGSSLRDAAGAVPKVPAEDGIASADDVDTTAAGGGSGSSPSDDPAGEAVTNFESDLPAEHFARCVASI